MALGDSIIAGIGAETCEETLAARLAGALAEQSGYAIEWRAVGESGYAIADLIEAIGKHPAGTRADVVLISIGVNDVTGLRTTSRWRGRIETLADRLRSRFPVALVVFAGLPPMDRFPLPPQPLRYCLGLRARQFDELLATAVGSRDGMLHVRTEIDPARHGFCADGFHPSGETYRIWADELAALLAPRLRPSPSPPAGDQPAPSQSRGTR